MHSAQRLQIYESLQRFDTKRTRAQVPYAESRPYESSPKGINDPEGKPGCLRASMERLPIRPNRHQGTRARRMKARTERDIG
jgi:hypothetical protein